MGSKEIDSMLCLFRYFRHENWTTNHIKIFKACSTALRTILHSWIGEYSLKGIDNR